MYLKLKTRFFFYHLLVLLLLSVYSTSAHGSFPVSLPGNGDKVSAAGNNQQSPSAPDPVFLTEPATSVTANVSQEPYFTGNRLAELQLLLEDLATRVYWRLEILSINSGRLWHDIRLSSASLAGLSHFSSFLSMILNLLLVFGAAALIEWLVRKLVLRRYLRKPADTPGEWSSRLWRTIVHCIPEVISLGIFTVAAYEMYILVYSSYFSVICPAFLATLLSIIVVRLFSILISILLSPSNSSLRLISCSDSTARVGHRSTILFTAVITVGVMIVSLLKYGGLSGDSLLLVKLFFGTFFIILAGIVLFLNRNTISSLFHPNAADEPQEDAAEYAPSKAWLIPACCYLILVWSIWCSKLIFSEAVFTLAFFMSLLIIPVFLLLDILMGWLFSLVSRSVSVQDELLAGEDGDIVTRKIPGMFHYYLRLASRVCLFGLLLLWVLHLWNIRFSYTPVLISAIERVIFITFVFFLVWQVIDRSISNYLAKKDDAAKDEDDSGESEWGEGVLLDRSQTLLPIVRKFLGILIFVLLVLFCLSSLGVNIGPLLAGAGVMGIAIGFGAQKLVSDLMSGFFFLVDDAFRVGEYIEAGSVKGTVEKITLRNLMLRHHRGMLQIVPHSDLGSVTNYMRGGIVVKFNLQFPYDTNVDMVRKVIKKVGISMLEDPELGPGLIKQLKSQGIREVGDSVLTIRAKFTAKPGTHFLIRREAYRRVTEALNEKGIYYAHRKVIVDIPDSGHSDSMEDETKKKLIQAGAASNINYQSKETG